MNKHAYLIITHYQFDFLKKLIQQLDSEYNDFYILIDKKSKVDLSLFQNITKQSKIELVSPIKINWGGFSQINAELILIKAALKSEYSYLHLISGADFPIKTKEEIYMTYENSNFQEYLELCDIKNNNEIAKRYKYFYFFQEYSCSTFRVIDKICVTIQKLLRINRNKNITFYKGSNWFSITNEFAKYVISREKDIRKVFRYTLCCDEVFLQTILMNSSFKKNLVEQGISPNKRFIVWDEKHIKSPKVLTLEDYSNIVNSKCLFARKFDVNKSNDLMQKLIELKEKRD